MKRLGLTEEEYETMKIQIEDPNRVAWSVENNLLTKY
jgi:hypothetical protein